MRAIQSAVGDQVWSLLFSQSVGDLQQDNITMDGYDPKHNKTYYTNLRHEGEGEGGGEEGGNNANSLLSVFVSVLTITPAWRMDRGSARIPIPIPPFKKWAND